MNPPDFNGKGRDGMQFEKVQRVVYQSNPLKQVICQLRFPTILKIEDERPIEFHGAIRAQFPYYAPVVEHMHNVSVSDNGGAYPDTLVSHSDTPNHTFESQDRCWKINLTSNFITLSTTCYTRWEDFRDRFLEPLKILENIYAPSFFNRIGLRYIDVIDRTALGLEGCGWAELLAGPVLGMLAINDGAGIKTIQSSQQSLLVLDEQRSMMIRTGLGTFDGQIDEVFVVDADTFIAQDTTICEVPALLDSLHEPVSRFFRWTITDKLHEAMRPKPLEG